MWNGRHVRSFQQTIRRPTAQIWTRLTTKYMEKYSSGSSKFMTSMNWSSLDRCLASFGTKHHRWRSWQVAQISPCVNTCERKTFLAFNLIPVMRMLLRIYCLLILRTLSKCYCVKCSRLSPISVFYIMQGSAATHLRRSGGNMAWILSQISRRIQQWKNYENRPTFARVMTYERMFFWLTVYSYVDSSYRKQLLIWMQMSGMV